MTWVLIAAFGLASWLSVAMLILGLCRAASLRPASEQPSVFAGDESNVVDFARVSSSAHPSARGRCAGA
jgi:hypothetical protein